jgi:hypothetical protein
MIRIIFEGGDWAHAAAGASIPAATTERLVSTCRLHPGRIHSFPALSNRFAVDLIR